MVQLDETARALRARGVDALTSVHEEPGLDGIDVVHGFGLRQRHIRWCRQHGKPVALAPVYCSARFRRGVPTAPTHAGLHRLAQRSRTGLSFLVAGLAGSLADKCSALDARDRELALAYESADLLLPNSVREGRDIAGDLSVTTPWHYVPNAVDPDVFGAGEGPGVDRQAGTVACVGRFEPRKNQLGLIRALRGTTYRLVLVGPRHSDHGRYWERCRAEASPSVTFLPPAEPAQLVDVYRRAAVHALPSWGESTGLASLEAAAMGCQVVVSHQGYSDQYFGDLAQYCEPASLRSIRAAVVAAAAAPARGELRDHVLSRFTWDQAAEASIQGYAKLGCC
jgi:glycosyltransferase involved in cell wall biosynthesis